MYHEWLRAKIRWFMLDEKQCQKAAEKQTHKCCILLSLTFSFISKIFDEASSQRGCFAQEPQICGAVVASCLRLMSRYGCS